jgi:hypothetical protein
MVLSFFSNQIKCGIKQYYFNQYALMERAYNTSVPQ